MRTVSIRAPREYTAARHRAHQRANRIAFYVLLAVIGACVLLLHGAATGNPLLPLAAAAPLVVSPATLGIWRAYIDHFEAARHRAGGYDEMRAAAAGLLGSVRALLAEHDAKHAQRDSD